LYEEERTPRLGEGVDESMQLSTAAMQRVIDVLDDYEQIISDKYTNTTEIVVTATSAVRDATNKMLFLDKVQRQTGLQVQVLSGREEARYTYFGAKSVLADEDFGQSDVVIDIGGGSTEIATGNKGTITNRYSFDMGCVRFTERFLNEDPHSESQIANCRNAIRQMLSEYEFTIQQGSTLIGVAGTVTSLGFIDMQLQQCEPEKLNGYTISLDTLREYINNFRIMTAEELIQKYPAVMSERADIFRAGLLILEGFMKQYHFEQVVVSTGGIRHGAIINSD